jgi:hypothetical protein
MRVRPVLFGLLALASTLALSEKAAFADVCIAGAVNYQLQIGTGNPASGTPILVTGERVVGTLRRPVVGSLTVHAGTAMIGLTEMFDFGSGLWTHPTATTVFIFPPSPAPPTFDTTYHGNGAPFNVNSTLSIIPCPVSPTTKVGRDPNRP